MLFFKYIFPAAVCDKNVLVKNGPKGSGHPFNQLI